MCFSACLAIAMLLSASVEAQNLYRLIKRPKGDHTNSTLAEMRACPFVVPPQVYMQFLADEVNLVMANIGLTYNSSDRQFHGKIAGWGPTVEISIPAVTSATMLIAWQTITTIEHPRFPDTIFTVAIDEDDRFQSAPRLQKAWETDFVAMDLADFPGMEQLKAAGWFCKIILASCWCGNPLTRAYLLPPPPQVQPTALPSAHTRVIADTARGGTTVNNNTYMINSGNTVVQQQPVPFMQQSMMQPPMPMVAPYPPGYIIASIPCAMPYNGRYQQCGNWEQPRGCFKDNHWYDPKPRYVPRVRPVHPVKPVNPTVRNTNVHQPPRLNQDTHGGDVNINPHNPPGTGGTTKYGGNPPLNPDGGPSVIDNPGGGSLGSNPPLVGGRTSNRSATRVNPTQDGRFVADYSARNSRLGQNATRTMAGAQQNPTRREQRQALRQERYQQQQQLSPRSFGSQRASAQQYQHVPAPRGMNMQMQQQSTRQVRMAQPYSQPAMRGFGGGGRSVGGYSRGGSVRGRR